MVNKRASKHAHKHSRSSSAIVENGQIQNTNTVRRKKARTTVPVTVGRRPYAKAAVFAFHYEKVDFEVIPQRDELLSVLRREYGFKTETYVIEDSDTSSQHQKLRKAMQTFLLEHKSDADEETLLIFYYGGHGLRGRDDKDDRIYFFENAEQENDWSDILDWWDMPDPLYLNWSDVSTVFHGSTANNQLLLNLDCCNAGSANMKEDVEVMGASVWDGMAASNPDFSFSGALIKELNLNKGRVVTSAQLIARMQHNADSKFRQAAMPFHRPSVIENKLPVLFYGVRKPHLVEGNQMTSMGQLPVQQSWKDVLQGAGKLIIALLVGLLIVIAFQGPKAPRCS